MLIWLIDSLVILFLKIIIYFYFKNKFPRRPSPLLRCVCCTENQKINFIYLLRLFFRVPLLVWIHIINIGIYTNKKRDYLTINCSYDLNFLWNFDLNNKIL